MRALLPLLLLAACSDGSDGHGPDDPGQVTADEARELNDAAAMLDANSVTPEAVANQGDAE